MEEIRYITEYPYGLKGTFEEEYLDLPKAVLVNVMEGHQRYIPLEKQDGIAPSGVHLLRQYRPRHTGRGNQGQRKGAEGPSRRWQVLLRGRQAGEARGPLREARSGHVPQEARQPEGQDRKGRTDRTVLSSAIDLPIGDKIERAAKLIKADLLTHMVGEFPELQGIMGRIYAEHQGEDPEIARAIEEHYCPIGTDGELPESALGSVMALADKFDSLIAFFSVGITPTGNLDPFALRRQAIGSIRTIIGKGYHIPLQKVFRRGLPGTSGTGQGGLRDPVGDPLGLHHAPGSSSS